MAETMSEPTQVASSTPLEVIANVSRVVTRVIDRITGDRVEVPLMVASACHEALKLYSIQSQIMYGPAAWVEILEDNSVVWAGCWGQNYSFWVATQYGEVVDLNVSIAYRKQAHQIPTQLPMLSPPMLWSAEVPMFYRYQPEGVAELELTSERDQHQYDIVLKEIREKCGTEKIVGVEPEFANEPILCPGRKLLDDSNESFKKFDRVIGVRGIPKSPF
jgi:hypothetical protein